MSILGKLVRGLLAQPTRPTKDIALPAEVEHWLAYRDMPQLQGWMQGRLKEDPDAPEFTLLLESANRHGWSAMDSEKLRIFGHYYAGDLSKAHELAIRHAHPEAFDADLFIIAIFALYHLGRFDDAYLLLANGREKGEYLAERADFAVVAALICQSANQREDMLRYIGQAWRLAPHDPVVALNAYGMYFEQGDMAAFEEVRREFQQGRYPLEQAGFAPAVIELAQDNYGEGFRLLELRYLMGEAQRYFNKALLGLSRWQGEKLHGRILLISAEQGLGDTIQVARYLPEVVKLADGRLALEVQQEALSLLRFNYPDIPMVERRYAILPEMKFDVWIGSMSLPHLLGSTADNVPGRQGYLRVPPENAAYWQRRVAELSTCQQLRVGFAWSGQPTHRADRRRSISFVEAMTAIRNLDVQFFALQTHVPDDCPSNLIDVSAELVTLADTLALIAEMDLVITVDTSVVHLAGALGKQAWLLLPYRYEWRWGLEGESNHWYDSVKVLRQKRHGDWKALLGEVFGSRLRDYELRKR